MNFNDWWHQVAPSLPVLAHVFLAGLAGWALVVRAYSAADLAKARADVERERAASVAAARNRADLTHAALLRICESDAARWVELSALMASLAADSAGAGATVTFEVTGTVPTNTPALRAIRPADRSAGPARTRGLGKLSGSVQGS